MGYTTEFTGEVQVSPRLNAAERDYLRKFSQSRRMASPLGPYALNTEDAAPDSNAVPEGQPGLWCQWVPNDNGSCLVWDGHEKFYRSSAWMTYRIDTFLRRGARVQHDLEHPVPGWEYPDALREFTCDHSLFGTVLATGQDGASWRIEVHDNEVTVVETAGPAPTEYVLFLLDRSRYFDLEREFDAAFDLDRNQYSVVVGRDPQLAAKVQELVAEIHPMAVPVEGDAALTLQDSEIGLTLTVDEGSIRIGLLADPALNHADRTFGLVQQLAIALTVRLGWIAYDPAQRVALRPTDAFRRRAIRLIRGWTEEPDGRWSWNVV